MFMGFDAAATNLLRFFLFPRRRPTPTEPNLLAALEGEQKVFQIKTLELEGSGGRRGRYRVRRASTPGTFYFSVLGNGGVPKEFWKLLASRRISAGVCHSVPSSHSTLEVWSAGYLGRAFILMWKTQYWPALKNVL